jgi:hypothetical protein
MILAIHIVAAACFLTTLTGMTGIALAILIITLGGISAWNRALLRGRRSPRAIEITSSGEAVARLATGENVPLRATRGLGITRHWVALSAPSRGAGMMVTSGMLGPQNARKLRLWALWGRMPGVASRQRPA